MSCSYAEYSVHFNVKDATFNIDDRVRILQYKNSFAKCSTPNRSEEVFVIRKVKHVVSWTFFISDLNCEETNGTLYEKELQKANPTEYRVEKVTKRKGYKLLSNRESVMIHLIAALIKRMYDSHHTKMNDLSKLGNVANNDVVKKAVVEYLKFV